MGDAVPALESAPAGWAIREAKIAPPAPGGLLRHRLVDRLTECSSALVTVVRGPAGSGKTTLLASWAQSGRAPGPVAWVSLDPDDDVPQLFWGWVAAALHRSAGIELNGAVTPSSVAEAVSAHRGPVVLVLDDLHVLRNGEVLAEIRALIRYAPPQLRLVIGTRQAPRLGLPRLRLDGTARELGPRDLAFSAEEATELLPASVSEPGAEALWRRTEGWAAGLRLAAMSLEREHDPARFVAEFAGSDRDVTDYLRYEVLETLDPGLQEFLLRTSPVDVLTAELAAELSGRHDAGVVLDELERTIAFVTHSGQPPVVRYHALFREFLAAELERRLPGEALVLHERAARWLYASGEPIAAVRHAFAARAWPLAADLLVESWPLIATTPPLLHELADGLLPAALAEPEHALLAAGSCLFRGEPEPAGALIDQAIASFRELGPERTERGVPLVGIVRLFRAQLIGDTDGVIAGAQALLDAQPAARPGQRTRVRAIALANLGIASVSLGRLDESEETLTRALDAARECGAVLTLQNALGHLALAAAGRGRLRLAASRAAEAVADAREHGIARVPQAFSAYFTLGLVSFMWNDLDGAARYLERAGDLADRAAFRRARVMSGLLASRVLAAREPARTDVALRRLGGLADDRRQIPLPSCFSWLETGLEARLRLARGDDPAEALGALGGSEPQSPASAVVAARVLLAAGEAADALARLGAAAGFADAHPVVEIEALTLEALARSQLHEREEAHAALEQALSLAAPDEYRRVFVEGGPPLALLLREHVRRGTAPRAFLDDVLAAFDRSATAIPITRHELLEPLSEREQAVLAYLPTMLSNQEIAGALFVSKNTVKTHLRHLYRKLGASNRRDAVEAGRRLGLL